MEPNVQKALHDKLYDRRKAGALEIEKLIREDLANNHHERIAKVVTQLCDNFVYDIHHPYARTGGLIGLAAASIALGSEVPQYLKQVVPPVLACFADQDARVRYYACESMYNIAKTSKGEILPYFNQVFDALAKLAADSEMSVKNGAELLDRLIKDIISESATSYVSMIEYPMPLDEMAANEDDTSAQRPTAFSLPKFIPLLQERILVLNPFTRSFLVSWITLLDSIPDLELISYLPSFLGGLFKFLNDPNQDVVTATQHVLERFLDEIKLVARVTKGLAGSRKSKMEDGRATSPADVNSVGSGELDVHGESAELNEKTKEVEMENEPVEGSNEENELEAEDSASEKDSSADGDWIPGQDVHVDYPKILDILVNFLGDPSDEHIQLTALRWIDSFFEICPEDILAFVPRLLNQVLPALSSDIDQVRLAGNKVNTSLVDYFMSLSDDEEQKRLEEPKRARSQSPASNAFGANRLSRDDRRDSAATGRPPRSGERTPMTDASRTASPVTARDMGALDASETSLDYEASVNALTLQFLNENEATRVAALSWLLMLQRRAPKKVLAAHDGTFPALLKTLSDPSDTVVTRDLQLLSQISKNSDDSYFTFFMVNLLKLFCTDRRLLETRGNLIVRQLCLNLSPERIYRTMADCLEKDEDVEFASIMVQNLNNNLITAPELADLRKKLRTWDTKESQTLFVTLFRSWCHNAVATISLCLLAQAYEQAYNLLQIFADIEMTVNMLIQIDKLVQLLESPVFTYLRLQLLEPSTYPFLYKTLYGILMLLPQSAAFAALKNRLNSVSAIGYLHIPQPSTYYPSSASVNNPSSTSSPVTSVSGAPQTSLRGQVAPGTQGVVSVAVPAFERANRLKPREESTNTGAVKWTELLDKFRAAQDRARRVSRAQLGLDGVSDGDGTGELGGMQRGGGTAGRGLGAVLGAGGAKPGSADDGIARGFAGLALGSRTAAGVASGAGAGITAEQAAKEGAAHGHRSKFSASQLGRFASGVGRRSTVSKK